MRDSDRKECKRCKKAFNYNLINAERRHHCRYCGEIFCQDCSQYALPIFAACNEIQRKFIKHYQKNWYDLSKIFSENSKDKLSFASSNNLNASKSKLSNTKLISNINQQQNNSPKLSNLLIENDTKVANDSFMTPIGPESTAMSAISDNDFKQQNKISNINNNNNNNIDINSIDYETRACLNCWLQYYRSVCSICGYEFCGKCRLQYHANKDCMESIEKKKRWMEDKKQEQETMIMMHNDGYRKCPGCGIMCFKFEGCNHMTHRNCKNGNNGSNCEFCYCCGELLFGSGKKYEKDDTLHFKGHNGVFDKCRKWKPIKQIDFNRDENGDRIKVMMNDNKQQCVVL